MALTLSCIHEKALRHGFGVGTFHFKSQLANLSEEHCVWALDFCGQGSSWPPEGAGAADLDGFAYSLDAWVQQVDHFLATIVGRPAYLAGNSLGGLVAITAAASSGGDEDTPTAAQPHPRVRGLILLNATPFWGFVPAAHSRPRVLDALLPWDGTLPPPRWITNVVLPYWDRFRSLGTIRRLLSLVYADGGATVDDALVAAIRRPTERASALATFASVLWSPKPQRSYAQALEVIRRRGLPVALVYGAEDPWVVPLWGQRLKRAVPHATYYEVSPCGHCPHHEAPEVVNRLITGWVAAVGAGAPPPDEPVVVAASGRGGDGGSRRAWVGGGGFGGEGGIVLGRRVDGRPRLPTEWLAYCLDSLFNGGGGLSRES